MNYCVDCKYSKNMLSVLEQFVNPKTKVYICEERSIIEKFSELDLVTGISKQNIYCQIVRLYNKDCEKFEHK